MKKKKSDKGKNTGKISLLAFGILIGFLVGGSSVWWFSNKDATFKFSGKLKKFFYSVISADNNNKALDNNKKTKKITKIKSNKNSEAINKISAQDSLLFNDPAYSEYYEQMDGNIDSLVSDTSNYNYSQKDFIDNEGPISYTEIVVEKDKLLFSKQIIVKEKNNETNNKNIMLDSVLLETKSNFKHKKFNIIVEFWKSPVNFKGYKMSKNKIVLYGLNYDENLKIEKIDDLFYLKNFDKYYLLEYSDSFKPLFIVQEPN
jgi:hypothetical protein